MFMASDQVFAHVFLVKRHFTTVAKRERCLRYLVRDLGSSLVGIECTGILPELFPCFAMCILEIFPRRTDVFKRRPLSNRHTRAPARILMRAKGREAVGRCQFPGVELCLLRVKSERVKRAVEYISLTHGQATRRRGKEVCGVIRMRWFERMIQGNE